MMEATQMTQNWMSHHAKQQTLANPSNSTGSGGPEPNSQLSGKHFNYIMIFSVFRHRHYL